MNKQHRILFITVVIISLVVGFGGGFFYFSQRTASDDAIITNITNRDGESVKAVDFGLFWQVWDKLHSTYADSSTLDAQKLVYGAISGMVDAAGDPYTVFFEPVTSKKFQEEVSGEFSGVGMEIGKRNDVITVVAPIKNSPAMRAGILAGDIIMSVDGEFADGWSVEEAVNRIRGKKGTTVKLTIVRAGTSEPLEFSLVRDTIRIPAVEWRMLENQIAYLQIYSFNANVDAEFVTSAKELRAAGAKRLIVDLRNNPGGLLDSAVNLGGWFLKSSSVVVQEKYSNGIIDKLHAKGNEQLSEMPMIILINGGSASAAEILAGALHDVRNVPLVGEKSFGKGSVQQLEEFYNGSSLKVTIAKWLTPNGVSISDTGIAPTTEVKLDPKDPNAKDWEIGTPGKDPQLDKAIELINK